MQKQDNQGGAVAGSFTLQAQLCNGKSLTFSGYVLQGETETEVNAKMDLAMKTIERQRLISEVPELEAKMSQTLVAKGQIETIIEDLTGREKLNSQQSQQLNTMRVNLKNVDEQIRTGEIAIATAKRLAATV